MWYNVIGSVRLELTNGGAAGIRSPERVGLGCPVEIRRVDSLVRAYLAGMCVIFVLLTTVSRSDYPDSRVSDYCGVLLSPRCGAI